MPDLPTKSRYPWDEWLDGSVWELTHGEDFKGRPATFRSVGKTQAKKRGGRLKTRLLRGKDDQPDRLYIEFKNEPGETYEHGSVGGGGV